MRDDTPRPNDTPRTITPERHSTSSIPHSTPPLRIPRYPFRSQLQLLCTPRRRFRSLLNRLRTPRHPFRSLLHPLCTPRLPFALYSSHSSLLASPFRSLLQPLRTPHSALQLVVQLFRSFRKHQRLPSPQMNTSISAPTHYHPESHCQCTDHSVSALISSCLTGYQATAQVRHHHSSFAWR